MRALWEQIPGLVVSVKLWPVDIELETTMKRKARSRSTHAGILLQPLHLAVPLAFSCLALGISGVPFTSTASYCC